MQGCVETRAQNIKKQTEIKHSRVMGGFAIM